ncbi:MAG TPA: permease prefix domain 2-containing transporter [Vicinamibacterales bacterium]|jgi:uncharacterized protein YqgC (DUF456 family)|nr:permease prefix domain 2-containing transporter [Vicinamibacterales bacterium]
MIRDEPIPPRWAEGLLLLLLKPADRESISGDLLEEYRAARRPALGALRANAWYIKHVLSVLWPLIRPCAFAVAAHAILLALTVFRPGHHAPHPAGDTNHSALTLTLVGALWYGSLAPAPLVSLLDGLIYFLAGYRGTRRTRLARTGILTAAATSIVGFVVLFAAAAAVTPGLVAGTIGHPFIVIILAVYLSFPLGYGALLGAVAGVVAKWIVPRDRGFRLPHAEF